MPITTCIFDAYGTLFDVAAAARQAAAEPDYKSFTPHWPKVAEDWRLKQLQYTWLRAVTGAHTDFWQVTQDGLDWALEANKLKTMLPCANASWRSIGNYRLIPKSPQFCHTSKLLASTPRFYRTDRLKCCKAPCDRPS